MRVDRFIAATGVLVAEPEGRGWTGSCSPGIFGQTAAEPSRLFGSGG